MKATGDLASRKRAAGTRAVIDVRVESPLWAREPEATSVVKRAVACAADAAGISGEVAVLLTDDAAIRRLNREWRRRDRATNVLSFPAPRPSGGGGRAAPEVGRALLGDIVIAFETTAREAAAEARPFSHHLAHLVVHGFLHLVGYDHASEAEAAAMERLEVDILARLGVPDPYRGQAPVPEYEHHA